MHKLTTTRREPGNAIPNTHFNSTSTDQKIRCYQPISNDESVNYLHVPAENNVESKIAHIVNKTDLENITTVTEDEPAFEKYLFESDGLTEEEYAAFNDAQDKENALRKCPSKRR